MRSSALMEKGKPGKLALHTADTATSAAINRWPARCGFAIDLPPLQPVLTLRALTERDVEMPYKRRVFISVQNPDILDPRRLALQNRIIMNVDRLGLQSEIFFHAGTAAAMAWSLQNASDVMRRCVGAIVIAFCRWTLAGPNGKEMRFASEYAQIEGAMATVLRLPLLMVAEKGLVDRGITWTGAGHPILFMPSDADINWLGSDGFVHRFGLVGPS